MKKTKKINTKSGKFTVKVDNKMRWMGDTDFDKKLIRINKSKHKGKNVPKTRTKKQELMDTMIHEKMHADHPRMKEKTVYKKTRKKMKTLKGNVKGSKKYGSIASV
jgi:SOS response regulatory protein OraA/RecX